MKRIAIEKQQKPNGTTALSVVENDTIENELEKALGVDAGNIKQMDFLDFQEVQLTDYEQEAIAATIAQAEAAKQAADAATIALQKAQSDIQAANATIATARIAQSTIFDLVRRRAGFANKQNWYDPAKNALIIDPN